MINGNVVGIFLNMCFYDGEIIIFIVLVNFQNVLVVVQFEIYQYEGDVILLYIFLLFVFCGDQLMINLDDVLVFFLGLGIKFFVDVVGICSFIFNDFVVCFIFFIQVCLSGNIGWILLGWLDEGQGFIMVLEKGVYYDFWIFYWIFECCVFNFQVLIVDFMVIIESFVYEYSFGVFFMEIIDVDYVDMDNDGIEEIVFFNYININVFDQVCQEYIDFLNVLIN